MLEVWIQITCDGCGSVMNSEGPNQTRAEYRKELRDGYGWVYRPGGLDYCRQCVKRGWNKIPVTGFNGPKE